MNFGVGFMMWVTYFLFIRTLFDMAKQSLSKWENVFFHLRRPCRNQDQILCLNVAVSHRHLSTIMISERLSRFLWNFKYQIWRIVCRLHILRSHSWFEHLYHHDICVHTPEQCCLKVNQISERCVSIDTTLAVSENLYIVTKLFINIETASTVLDMTSS